MTVLDIVNLTRIDYLDDTLEPYEWSNTILAQFATEAQRQATKRASLILDDTTQTADNAASGTTTSTTADKLVDSTAAFTSALVGDTAYNTTNNTWAVISAVDSTTTLSLADDIMASGEGYVIGDASKALCKVCVTAGVGKYTLSPKVLKIDYCYLDSKGGVPLVHKTKGWLDRNYYQWRLAEGTPMYYLEERGRITLVPMPNAAFNSNTGIDTLNLSVYRLPLVDLSLASNTELEIPEEYHLLLIDYICYLCYSKQNSAAYDKDKAMKHLAIFTANFGQELSAHAESILREIPSDFAFETRDFGL